MPEAVTALYFMSLMEMKRSMREAPQLNIAGTLDVAPAMQDWEAGSIKANKPA